MKTIILVRHAKSSWDSSITNDRERPLNERGFRDAQFMAEKFLERQITPDVILSSPALRAITTSKYFAEKLNFLDNSIFVEEDIYNKGTGNILKLINKLDNSINKCMIFGHNPEITELSTFFSMDIFAHVPTCGIVCLVFNANDWEELTSFQAKVTFFDFPKRYLKSKYKE